MAQNASVGAGAGRASREFPRHAPSATGDARSPPSTHRERHLPFRHGRHHRAQQPAHSKEPSLEPPAPLAERLNPSKVSIALGRDATKATLSPSASLHIASRDPSKERSVGEKSQGTMPREWTWDEVKMEKRRNEQRNRTVLKSYSNLSATVQHHSIELNSLQNSLDSTLASAGKLLSQLRDLRQYSTTSLNTLTETSIPNLSQTSETHLAILQRTHVSNSISQLATLKARIGSARERTTGLQHRLEKCAQRAAIEEERERTEMRRHKRRVWAIWSVLAAIVIAWVAAFIWRGTEIGLENRIFDFEELARARQELRTVLESKGLDWALDDDDFLMHDARVASAQPTEQFHGVSRPSPAAFPGPSDTHTPKVNSGHLDDKLDRLFGHL